MLYRNAANIPLLINIYKGVFIPILCLHWLMSKQSYQKGISVFKIFNLHIFLYVFIAVQNKLNLYFKIKKRYTQPSFHRTLVRHSSEGRNQTAVDLYFCFRKIDMMSQKEKMLSLKKK